jgi:crotonobetainyl-CoA:carnitine CoA-transferase CaiB-like acyl-CoA transferase
MAVDPRYLTNRARIENVETLEVELTQVLSERSTDEWFALIEPANVCAIGKVNSVADLFDDPHVAARAMLVDVPMPYGKPGTLKLPNSPLHLSGTPTMVRKTMPEHGGDTDDVLGRWLSVSDEESAELRNRGIVK